jgi:hypothetical protein
VSQLALPSATQTRAWRDHPARGVASGDCRLASLRAQSRGFSAGVGTERGDAPGPVRLLRYLRSACWEEPAFMPRTAPAQIGSERNWPDWESFFNQMRMALRLTPTND